MNKIQKISSPFLVLFNLLLIVIPLAVMLQWIFITTKTTDVSGIVNLFGIFEQTVDTPEGCRNLSDVSWTPFLQFLGFVATFIGIVPFLMSLRILKNIFSNYQKGEVFTVDNALWYRRLGIIFLFDALLIKMLSQTLLVIAITHTNPPGHRYLTISFGTPHATTLFYGVIIIVVSWVMLEASRLHDEQKLTI